MPTADVIDLHKQKMGNIELNNQLFGAKVNSTLIHEAVVMQQAAKRQGTAATKTKGLVRGGGRKPWKQKGTGRARAGSTRSPIWRGGGTVFGPNPRKYAYPFPRKKYRAAMRGVLSAKLRDGELMILENISLEEGKTKQMAQILKTLGATGRTIVVLSQPDAVLERAAQNLREVKLLSVPGLNLYDLICARHILLPKGALEALEKAWS